MGSRVVVFVLLFVFLASGSGSAQISSILILTNVNVVDVRNGTVAHNRTVAIQNGRIVGIARFGIVEGGPDVEVVNGGGKYLIPGLWDMNAVPAKNPAWTDDALYPLYLVNGVTGVRETSGDLQKLQATASRIASGDLLGPRVVFGGKFLGEQSASEDPAPSTNSGAAPAAANSGIQPDDPILGGLRLENGVEHTVSALDAAEAGQRSIERLAGIALVCSSQESQLRDRMTLAIQAHDDQTLMSAEAEAIASYEPQKAHAAFVRLADHAVWQIPALVQIENWANRDPESAPWQKYIPRPVLAQWEQAKAQEDASPEQAQLDKEEAADDIQLATAMRRAGVQFLTGTDAPSPFVVPGFSIHEEMEWLVKSGFSPLQALQAATFNPALFLAQLDKYGVIERGRFADMVLLDANPLEDIANTQKIAAVILDGHYYSRRNLDAILRRMLERPGPPE